MITVLIEGMRLESEANKRGHWTKGAKRAASTRGAVTMAMRCRAMVPGLTLDKGVAVTITRIAPRPLDDDNNARACKAVRDGIADWLGIDDRDERVSWRYEQRKDQRAHYYGVEIRIEARKHCEACGQVVTEEA